MKGVQAVVGFAVLLAVLGGVWVVGFHPQWIRPEAGEEEEKPPETDVPVKTAMVVRTTLRQYVDGYGAVDPAPAMEGTPPRPAAEANVSSPVQGTVSQVLCAPGQRVEQGATLVQLDERLARAQEAQAQAVLDSAKASLAKLKATPRPEQIELARLAVQKAQGAFDLAQKNYQRQKTLAPEQVTSAKVLETAETDMNAARVDLASAQGQLALLKASPTPEELAEAQAKVGEAERGLAVAQAQRGLLKIQSPLAGTVLRVAVSAGEAVDSTKVLAEVGDLDRLAVVAAVPAAQLPVLALGQPVQVMERGAGADSGEAGSKSEVRGETPSTQSSVNPEPRTPNASTQPTCEGRVCFIAPEVDRKTDTVLVGVALPANAGLRPGQFVRIRIQVRQHADRLAVPVESVVIDEEGNSVIAIVNGEKAVQRPVHAGLREDGLVEVAGEGVREGDVVVTTGAYGLPKETKVHLIK